MRHLPNENSRRCILSGERDARAELIRLALSPDGVVAPDVRARAPGRGAWIGVDRATLSAAQAKGKLRAALARAFKLPAPVIPDDLAGAIESALARDALDRLGLESRAGKLISGSDRIADAARKGQVVALYHAADAGIDGRRKLDQAWRVGSDAEGSGRQGVALPVDRHILSKAVGRENAVHIALTDAGSAVRVGEAVARWQRFVGSGEAEAPCENGAQGSFGA